MRQVLLRAMGLVKRPWVAATLAVFALGAVVLAALVPLFGVPGYELSAALALGLGTLGGIIGGAAGFQERRLIQGQGALPPSLIHDDSPLRAAGMPILAAFALSVASLVPPLLSSALLALWSTRCDPFLHLGFFPLLALPSALMSASAGVLAAFASRTVRGAVAAYAAMVCATLLATFFPVLFGPQVFAFNHFLGYLPGPLYDESLRVTPALWWFRMETLLIAAVLWAGAALFLDRRTGRLSVANLRPTVGLVVGLLLAAIVVVEQNAAALGLRMSTSALVERLGGKRETDHFTFVFPRGKPKEEVERFVRDLEFRHHQIQEFLGSAPKRKIRVYLYRSPAEKQELVGAALTQFAKPWRLELHLNDGPFPSSALRHELAHVMAAPLGSAPFGVTARAFVWPIMGVIEGLAVAADERVDELTLHEWAAGMRKHKLLPDVRRIVRPLGFYGAAPSRAYTAVGSFIRHLAEQYGRDKLAQLYRSADFEGVYGRRLDGLVDDWEQHLDALPLDDAMVNQAFARFRQGALFQRTCAREVARLSEEAEALLFGDPDESLRLYRRCSELQPEEPSFRLGEARALYRLDRVEEAGSVLASLEEKLVAHQQLLGEVLMAQADLAYLSGDAALAELRLSRILSLEVAPQLERTAHIKRTALESPEAQKAVWAYFQPGHEEVKLVRLRDALEGKRDDAFVHYLLGRRLVQRDAPELARPHLEAATKSALPDSLKRESYRLRLEAEYRAGDCKAVQQTAGELPDLGQKLRVQAEEWASRCKFEERVFNGPLVPKDPFR